MEELLSEEKESDRNKKVNSTDQSKECLKKTDEQEHCSESNIPQDNINQLLLEFQLMTNDTFVLDENCSLRSSPDFPDIDYIDSNDSSDDENHDYLIMIIT